MPLNPTYSANPDPRVPCLLLLDTSASMHGAPLQALNQGLRDFQVDLQEDALARRRAEISIVTFGGSVQTVQDFVSAASFAAPTLTAEGNTPMGEAIAHSVTMVKHKEQELRENGVPRYKPWIFLMTDGEPTDEWHSAAELVKGELASNSMCFFGVGVGAQANLEVLSQITPRALRLDGLKFHECFLWITASLKSVSGGRVGDQVALPPVNFDSPV
jgi:uncharacterized protein YegL